MTIPEPSGGARSVMIIVPAHNEAENIRGVLADLARKMPGAEVVVVDDASADDTSATAAPCQPHSSVDRASGGRPGRSRGGRAACWGA